MVCAGSVAKVSKCADWRRDRRGIWSTTMTARHRRGAVYNSVSGRGQHDLPVFWRRRRPLVGPGLRQRQVVMSQEQTNIDRLDAVVGELDIEHCAISAELLELPRRSDLHRSSGNSDD